jgi:hypothetical protein
MGSIRCAREFSEMRAKIVDLSARRHRLNAREILDFEIFGAEHFRDNAGPTQF